MAEYCLRWNNHQPNLVTVFSELLNAESLVDVTLATDGHFIHAHKLVLSACSAYFKDLFGSNPCKHPIVFLKDIRIEDLKTVIDFIYRGEVNVAQERLQDVLKTAESLRIKGLADKPFNYDEYPSQNRGQHLSSSFSSQKSSLSDSRELSQSVENEDSGTVSLSEAPAPKKRKVTPSSSNESAESTAIQDHTNHEVERPPSEIRGASPLKLSAGTPPEEDKKPNVTPTIFVRNIKSEDGEKCSSEPRVEHHENRAADAMLLLHGRSSSDGAVGGEEGSHTPTTSISSSRLESTPTPVSTHAQGKFKRGMLQRQTGIIREVGNEDMTPPPPYSASELINSTPSETLNVSSSAHSSPINYSVLTSIASTKSLQVPTVFVGSHYEKSQSYAYVSTPQKQTTKLMVPATSCTLTQTIKQKSYPEMSRSHSEGIHHSNMESQIQSTQSNLQIPDYSNASQSSQSYTVIPMHIIKKQRSSPGVLSSTPSHLRPIHPKPSPLVEKEVPIIQFTPSTPSGIDEEISYSQQIPSQTQVQPSRISRAISEDPDPSRGIDRLAVGSHAPLTQSLSHDAGVDGNLSAVNRLLTSSSQSTTGSVSSKLSSVEEANSDSPHHTPVLREGPALGCNYCWNSQDNHGRVQRRKTKYHCPACRTNLCIVPCFHEYHSQIQLQHDQNKQFQKFFNKSTA